MKNIFTIVFILYSIYSSAQDSKKDTNSYNFGKRIYDTRIGRYMSAEPNNKNYYQNAEPEVSLAVIKAVEKSACDCMNKLELKPLTSPERRKNAMNNCLKQATIENEAVITTDRNASTNKGYDAGKKYGVALGKKIGQLLKNNCPIFKILSQ
jgi:hypothetical protein